MKKFLAGILITTLGAACIPACAQPPDAKTATQKAPEFATADDLLTALEKADAGLVTLTSRIVYDKVSIISSDHQIRKGKLYYIARPEAKGDEPKTPPAETPGRKFAVKFDEYWIGDEVRSEEMAMIFDGQWLVEKNFKTKDFIKNQVVPPGEKFDPLKIGEGPFPVPIGQQKQDIQLRYTTTLVPVGEGLDPATDASAAELADAKKLLTHVEGATQIKLTPKPDFAAEDDFKEVRLWYRRGKDGNLLPVMARTVNRGDDVSVVQLSDVEVQLLGKPRNEKAMVPVDVVDTRRPPDGWNFQQRDWRKHVGGN